MHTPTPTGGPRSAVVRGWTLRRWLLALGVIAGLLLSHVLSDHDAVPGHPVAGSSAATASVGGFEPDGLTAPAAAGSDGLSAPAAESVPVADRVGGSVELPSIPLPAGIDPLAGCVLALLVLVGAAAVIALAGRRSPAGPGQGSCPVGPDSPDGRAPARVALCVLRV